MKIHFAIFISAVLLLCVTITPTTIAQTDQDYPVITPENIAQVEQLKIFGEGIVNDVIFSPDEQYVAMSTSIGVWLYSIDDLTTPIRLFGNYEIDVTHAIFNADSTRLFGGIYGGSVYVWDVASGELLKTLIDINKEEWWMGDPITQIYLSDDEKTLFVITRHNLTVWNLADTRLEHNIELLCCYSVLSPNKKHILSLSEYPPENTSSVKVTEIESGFSYELESYGNLISYPNFSHTGEEILGYIQIDHMDGAVTIWKTETGEFLHHVGVVVDSLGFSERGYAKNIPPKANIPNKQNEFSLYQPRPILSRDKSKIFMFDEFGMVSIWDIESNLLLHIFSIDNIATKDSLFKPYETIEIHKTVNEAELLRLINEEEILYHIPLKFAEREEDDYGYWDLEIGLSPKHTYFTMIGRIWSVYTGEMTFRMNLADRCSSGNGSTLMLNNTRIVNYTYNRACVWDVVNEELLYTVRTEEANPDWVKSFPESHINLNNQHFLVIKNSSSYDINSFLNIQIWDLMNDSFIEIMTEYRGARGLGGIYYANFSHNEEYLVTVGSDTNENAHIWDLQTGSLIQEINTNDTTHRSPVNITISPNNRLIAITEYDGSVWDFENNRLLYNSLDHGFYIYNFLFSTDSSLILTTSPNGDGDSDDTIHLWDAENGKLIYTLKESTRNIVFNHDSSQFAFLSHNPEIGSFVSIRETKTGTEIFRIVASNDDNYLNMGISWISFSPVANILLVALDGNIQLWDTNTFTLIHTVNITPDDYPKTANFNNEGNLILLEMRDGTIRLFGVPTP